MLKIEQIPLDDLVPHPRNPRSHGEEQVPHLVTRLREDGWYANVVLANDRRTILKGHGMVKAARVWGKEETAPCHVKDYAPDSREALKLMVGDNEVGRLAEDDEKQLATLLNELCDENELLGTGYDQAALEELCAELQAAEALNDFPEYDENLGEDPGAVEVEGPVYSRRGEVYQLGRHRVACADCRESMDLGADCPTLLFDPPFDDDLMSERDWGERQDVLCFCDARRAAGAVNGWHGTPPRWLFTWDCASSWYTRGNPLMRTKQCWWLSAHGEYDEDGAHYGESGKARQVSNTRGSYWFTPDARGKHLSDCFAMPITKLHADGPSHEKPEDWVRLLLGNCTRGDVFDPCAGTGTTIIACERLNRTCVACESEPKYCDVIRRRYATFVGDESLLPEAGASE